MALAIAYSTIIIVSLCLIAYALIDDRKKKKQASQV
jgi:hypothetical protein